MDSKQDFFKVIYRYYSEIVEEKLSSDLLEGLCWCITEYYYEQYTRFKIQYPKSAKRYSSFQTKDLDHPYTFELIIKFLKNKTGVLYSKYALIVLNISLEELNKFEKDRKDFYNMF